MNFFYGIHAAVGLGEQGLDLVAVFWTECRSHAQRDYVAAAAVASGLNGGLIQAIRFFLRGFRSETESGDHEFIAAHASDVIVAAAGIFQANAELAQKFVSLQMTERVIDLLETVDVADHDGQRGLHAAAARHLLREMHKQRPRVRQSGEEVGGGRAFRLLILQRILHRKCDLGSDG